MNAETYAELESEHHKVRSSLSENQVSNQRLEARIAELEGQLEMKGFEYQLLHNSKHEQDALVSKQNQHILELNEEKSVFEARANLAASLEEQVATLRESEGKWSQAQTQIVSLKEAAQTHKMKMSALEFELKEKQREITDLNHCLQVSRQRVQEMSGVRHELEMNKNSNIELRAQIDTLQTSLTRTQLQSDEVRNYISDFLCLCVSRMECKE